MSRPEEHNASKYLQPGVLIPHSFPVSDKDSIGGADALGKNILTCLFRLSTIFYQQFRFYPEFLTKRQTNIKPLVYMEIKRIGITRTIGSEQESSWRIRGSHMKCSPTSLHPAMDVVLYSTVQYNLNNLR